MSTEKGPERNDPRIDINKPRQNNDTIPTPVISSIEDTTKCYKMDQGETTIGKPTDLLLQCSSHLVSSITSSLADTPGDSGVICLDSEASETTSHALMSHSLIGAEELTCDSQCDAMATSNQDLTKSTTSSIMTRSDIDNQNISLDDIVPELLIESHKKSPLNENLPDVILKALESEKIGDTSLKATGWASEPKKSLSEDIVYRRRCRKKSQSGPSSQKKRVSFHEDILNNTKTDNIHIERGFVSYGPDGAHCDRFHQRNNTTDRFSWCASGDQMPKYAADIAQQTMSDILTYGDHDGNKTGIFEYCQDNRGETKNKSEHKNDQDKDNESKRKKKLYKCDSNSSDSNFSSESESSATDSSASNCNNVDNFPVNRKCDKAQKSYSCDEFNSNGHVTFMRKTYFSEADIDQSHERIKKPLEVTSSPSNVKSVLKKNRYITTNVVEEKKQNKVLNILDTNNIIESLKRFYKNFNFNLSAERGLPDTCLDLNNVVEAIPSDVNKMKSISKSLDSGFQIDDVDEFVEINLNEPNNVTKPLKDNINLDVIKEGSPRHKLTLNMKMEPAKPGACTSDAFPSKYVVNCESTVYEHTGVSYSYVHDTFQTAFDAPKQAFVPLPENAPSEELNLPANNKADQPLMLIDMDSPSITSTPKRLFNKNIQDETDLKSGISKHLSSPKKQNVNRYSRKISKNAQKCSEEQLTQVTNDNCSNTDNSTLKGEELNEYLLDSPSNQNLFSNKSVLLNRYLKNVCQKKDLEINIRRNKFFQNKLRLEQKYPTIVYPMNLVSESYHISAARMSRLIDKEVIENKRLSVRLLTADEPSYFDSFEDNVAIECSEKLRLQIFSYPGETLNRMLKVQSPYRMEDGSWSPLLVFITDYALYVADVKSGGTEYDLLCRLPHDELDAIFVGPESQYIQVVDTLGNICCSVVTGDASLGVRLVSSLEWSARTSPLKAQRPPAVILLSYKQLLVSVARQRHEKQLSQALFYGRACTVDAGERVVEAPGAFAPPLEGYLMCRMEVHGRFEPYYFLLRGGILQWGPHSPDGFSPLPHNIALRSVIGMRRYIDNTRRPHCFEIALNDSRLLLAAPDDPTASSWLQSLLLHAAQALEDKKNPHVTDSNSGGPLGACSVLVTPNEILSLRETLEPSFVVGAAPYLKEKDADSLLKEYIAEMRTDIEILVCGSVKNLTAFKIPDSDENWCYLEWSVCEARERGAGLALIFASSAELERFIAAVERAFCALTCEPFPLSVVVDTCTSVCSAAHDKYESAWSHMLPTQQ